MDNGRYHTKHELDILIVNCRYQGAFVKQLEQRLSDVVLSGTSTSSKVNWRCWRDSSSIKCPLLKQRQQLVLKHESHKEKNFWVVCSPPLIGNSLDLKLVQESWKDCKMSTVQPKGSNLTQTKTASEEKTLLSKSPEKTGRPLNPNQLWRMEPHWDA